MRQRSVIRKLAFSACAAAVMMTGAFARAEAPPLPTTKPTGTPGEKPAKVPTEKDFAAYLFAFFKDDDHSLHFAISRDGYTFTDVNRGKPIMSGRDLAEQKGVRDPYIVRARTARS
ncbi:MAG: hypothetical protein QM754_08640 [Tepidisphaeraceae bacterium]